MIRLHITMILSLFLLWGCASGPTLAESESGIPSLAPSNGRVFIYSVDSDEAWRTDILVDGQNVGVLVAGGVFFKDLPAGAHGIDSGLGQHLEFQLFAGETRYVKWVSGTSLLLIHPDQGSQEIRSLVYLGR
jgi:hypothetical protein